MRKILFVLLCSITAQMCMAQMTTTALSVASKMVMNEFKIQSSIIDDRINESSERVVCSSFRKLKAEAPEPIGLSMGFVGMVVRDSVRINLNFFLQRSIKSINVPEGTYVLIKLSDGSVLKKYVEYSYEPMPVVTSLLGQVFNMYYRNIAVNLTQEELHLLLQGFSKVRLEVNSNIFDYNIKKNNIIDFLAESYNLVSSRLLKKRSFDDDF